MPFETIISESKINAGRREISDETLSESGFYWREHAGVKILVSRLLEDAKFTNGFSTRLGGVSPFPKNDLNLAGFGEDTAENIGENRRRFLAALGGSFELATAWQVHGDNVKIVASREDAASSDERADALISDLGGILVGVKTADCVPVLIGDKKNGAFAAVHAGWRGTVRSIVVGAVEALSRRYGSSAADLVCAIGPAAGREHYEIGQDVIDAFTAAFEDSRDYFSPTRRGHSLIDLQLAIRRQLTGAGVSGTSISTAPFCTMESSNLFFSYRIEKKLFGKTGRLLSVIGKG